MARSSEGRSGKQIVNYVYDKADVPADVADVLAEQQLEIVKIWRRGPRFWTGLVRLPDNGDIPGQEAVLKVVLNDWPWQLQTNATEWHSSDQLLAEADVLLALGEYRHRLSGHLPSILGHKRDRPAWTLRSMVYGRGIDLAANGFGFDSTTWHSQDTKRLVNYIRDYQKLSLELPELAVSTAKGDPQYMDAWVSWLDLDNPAEALTTYSYDIKNYLTDLVPWVKSLPHVLVHGEVYPMHIYVDEGKLALIDWENAQRGNEMIDLVTYWLRGTTHIDWQADFKRQVADSERLLNPNEFNKLWDFMVVTGAAGTIRHLELAPEIAPEFRQAAVTDLVQIVRTALYQK